jgi:hypothetical protein
LKKILVLIFIISCAKDNKPTISNIKDDGFFVETVSQLHRSLTIALLPQI